MNNTTVLTKSRVFARQGILKNEALNNLQLLGQIHVVRTTK